MSTLDMNGGPAFPTATGSDGGVAFCGMSLRDYFAGQAIAGRAGTLEHGVVYAVDLAAECYAIADAMIEHRNKTNGGNKP